MKLGVEIKELKAAKLTDAEIELLPKYINGELEFYDSPAFNKLFEYYCFETGEMPYGTAKARDGMPDEWILDLLTPFRELRNHVGGRW